MTEPLELKKTLNLPKTDFAMKASLPQNEPKQLEAWQAANLYEQILAARADKPLFVLHDGPPYPTGTIHLGTAPRTCPVGIATACPLKPKLKSSWVVKVKFHPRNSARCAATTRRATWS